jgi:hypothetical protein
VRLEPLVDGGGHERGMRSGTLNVPGIVGFGRAAEVNAAEMPAESGRLAAMRNRLYDGLRERLPGVGLNGPVENRLPHNLNVHFQGVEGESILMAIDDIALSSGSACASGTVEPSYVLKACGVPDALALASVRFGLGRFTSDEEIDYAIAKVATVIADLRARRATLTRALTAQRVRLLLIAACRHRPPRLSSPRPISPARASAGSKHHRADHLVQRHERDHERLQLDAPRRVLGCDDHGQSQRHAGLRDEPRPQPPAGPPAGQWRRHSGPAARIAPKRSSERASVTTHS